MLRCAIRNPVCASLETERSQVLSARFVVPKSGKGIGLSTNYFRGHPKTAVRMRLDLQSGPHAQTCERNKALSRFYTRAIMYKASLQG